MCCQKPANSHLNYNTTLTSRTGVVTFSWPGIATHCYGQAGRNSAWQCQEREAGSDSRYLYKFTMTYRKVGQSDLVSYF